MSERQEKEPMKGSSPVGAGQGSTTPAAHSSSSQRSARQSPEEIVANARTASLLFAAKRALPYLWNAPLEGALTAYDDLKRAVDAIEEADR